MTYRGHIKNGVAILDTRVMLPDGTPVRVEVEHADSDFWRGHSVNELSSEQGIQPIKSLDELVIDWPDEDSVDELLALIREVRH